MQCGAKLGASGAVDFFFTSTILEKQDRGGECSSVSDADMKNCSDRDCCISRTHILLPEGNITGGGQFNVTPNGSSRQLMILELAGHLY